MTGNWQKVAKSVKTLREQLGWSQQELSERSRVSVATIRDTERAAGRRSPRTLQDLSIAFGLDQDYLSNILNRHT